MKETKTHEKSVNEKFTKYRCLVTGSGGFIASKLVERLRELGHDVFPYEINDGKDILDINQLEEAVRNVDVVYHIAAQADLTEMQRGVGSGRRGTTLNVYGTHNVAAVCAKLNKWVIYASTVCVYGNQPAGVAESEDTTLPNPSELYAYSKLAGELLIKGYSANYGMPYTILRFATIYGPGMRPALGLHVFFRQAMAGEPITVHGDGSQDRTLTFIDDLVDGIVAPLSHEKEAKNQTFNLSASVAVSAKQMAEDVKELTNSKSEITFIEQRANQTMHENFDVSKAKKLLGWEAKTPWKKGIAQTLNWMETKA